MRPFRALPFALLSLCLSATAFAQDDDAEAEADAEVETGAAASTGGSLQMGGPSAGMLAGFGRAGVFVIGAERLFGFSQTSSTIKEKDPATPREIEQNHTSFFFLGSDPQNTPFIAPRIGFDYFIVDSVSVGASITYISDAQDGKTIAGGTTTPQDDVKTRSFLFAPRAGYALMFGETFGLWPRAGVTYLSTTVETGAASETSASMLALSVEGNLVITPVPHVGFLIGPTLDFGFTGSGEEKAAAATTQYDSVKMTTFGLQAGLFIWL